MVQLLTLDTVVLTTSQTKYTQEVNLSDIAEAAVLVTSSAGSITVTQQISFDSGANWYDIEDGAGNATGLVVATMTVGTKATSENLKFAPSSRFKIVEGGTAGTNVIIKLALKDKITKKE